MAQKIESLSPIPAIKFYSNYSVVRKKIEKIEERHNNSHWLYEDTHQMPQRLLGPSQDWAVFYKQAEALDLAETKNLTKTNLLTFVCEKTDGSRRFVVAHPEVFWFYFDRRLPERKCAYEVIPEGVPCLLYLDLEFPKDLNKNSNGPRMTKTIIDIICAYIKKSWNISCNETNVLNLDSTTNTKFSRHVIFRIEKVAFKDNIHVGRFIKNICADIEEYLATNGCAFHEILSYFEREYLEELIIETKKRRKLFIDTNVYTRNRHFRIYKATKWGKLSHLQLAPENNYIPLENIKDKELEIFLESLISYFPDKRQLILLTVNEDSTIDTKRYSQLNQKNQPQKYSSDLMKESPYPAIDKFIADLVNPGTIRVVKFNEELQTIKYEIIGNRYCANIGRPHKSNNIYWIADLKRRHAFQKCHDQDDCANFKSDVVPFPYEISFLLHEEDDNLFFDVPENSESSNTSINMNTSI